MGRHGLITHWVWLGGYGGGTGRLYRAELQHLLWVSINGGKGEMWYTLACPCLAISLRQQSLHRRERLPIFRLATHSVPLVKQQDTRSQRRPCSWLSWAAFETRQLKQDNLKVRGGQQQWPLTYIDMRTPSGYIICFKSIKYSYEWFLVYRITINIRLQLVDICHQNLINHKHLESKRICALTVPVVILHTT